MKKVSQTKQQIARKTLIFGAPFTGKSTVTSRLAEHFNLIWFDLENGHDVLYKLPVEQQDRITLVDLPDTRSFPIAIETCLKVIKGAPVSICDTHGKVGCAICKRQVSEQCKGNETLFPEQVHLDFFTDIELQSLSTDTIVVFDSLTQLANSAIAHITKDKPDDYKLEYDDWGNLGKLLDIFLSHVQQARCHIIVTSHEQEIETEGKKTVLSPVGGTRNYSRNIGRFFDDIVYCERKNKSHRFASSTTYANNILSGSRSDVAIENYADDPSPLLRIYRPDLFPDMDKDSNSNKTSTSTGGARASSILNKLNK